MTMILVMFGRAIAGGLLELLTWANTCRSAVPSDRPTRGGLVSPGDHPAFPRSGPPSPSSESAASAPSTILPTPQSRRVREPRSSWATVNLCVVAFILLHGIASTPAMRFLDKRRRRSRVDRRACAGWPCTAELCPPRSRLPCLPQQTWLFGTAKGGR